MSGPLMSNQDDERLQTVSWMIHPTFPPALQLLQSVWIYGCVFLLWHMLVPCYYEYLLDGLMSFDLAGQLNATATGRLGAGRLDGSPNKGRGCCFWFNICWSCADCIPAPESLWDKTTVTVLVVFKGRPSSGWRESNVGDSDSNLMILSAEPMEKSSSKPETSQWQQDALVTSMIKTSITKSKSNTEQLLCLPSLIDIILYLTIVS